MSGEIVEVNEELGDAPQVPRPRAPRATRRSPRAALTHCVDAPRRSRPCRSTSTRTLRARAGSARSRSAPTPRPRPLRRENAARRAPRAGQPAPARPRLSARPLLPPPRRSRTRRSSTSSWTRPGPRPPPPLPYKVDTSRPSLRTNWTCRPSRRGGRDLLHAHAPLASRRHAAACALSLRGRCAAAAGAALPPPHAAPGPAPPDRVDPPRRHTTSSLRSRRELFCQKSKKASPEASGDWATLGVRCGVPTTRRGTMHHCMQRKPPRCVAVRAAPRVRRS